MKNTFEQSRDQHGVPLLLSRRTLIAGISTVIVLLVFLLADVLYVQFPLVTRTGDANLQRWVGPDTVKLVGLAIFLLLGGCYLATAVWGTHEQELAWAWKLGALGGTGTSMIILLLYALTGLPATSLNISIPTLVLYGSVLLGTLVVAFLGGKKVGRISAGTIAGFWFGVVLALIAGMSILARDTLFAQHLASTAWQGDHFGDLLCQGATSTKLIACEVGDDIGFMANSLLLFPLLGLLLGTGGGALGRLFTHRKTVQTTHWNMALITPLLCTGLLLIVFVVEAIWNLW